jgi:hypothetical protein
MRGRVQIKTNDIGGLLLKGVEKELLEDWDLDIEEHRATAEVGSGWRRPHPKLAHKLMFLYAGGYTARQCVYSG